MERTSPWSRPSCVILLVLGCAALSGCDQAPAQLADAGPEVDAHVPCATGKIRCDGLCTDPSIDPDHCGGCGVTCGGAEECVGGACQLRCPEGRSACGQKCVDLGSDPTSCGGCGVTCEHDEVCSRGQCEFVCAASLTECDRSCVDTTSSVDHCSACNVPCPTAPGTAPVCADGVCGLVCLEGFADCDDDLHRPTTNGCEVDLRADPSHCGACRRACELDHATAACVLGECAVGECAAAFADCNGEPADGCEADTHASLAHCGGCGLTCERDGASAVCEAGICARGDCLGSSRDCNGLDADGCEIDVDTDPSHCGACGAACALDYADATCVAGGCEVDGCEVDFGDCNGEPADGCEVDLTGDPRHCGDCGQPCPERAHATPVCEDGGCGFACQPGFADCDGLADNGCEARLDIDAEHCGGCGDACPSGDRCIAGGCDAGFRFVFVTAGAYDGALGGLEGADALCQAEARAAELPGTYRAWLSDGDQGPASRFSNPLGGAFRRVDGSSIAGGAPDLLDGALDAPIDRDAFGEEQSGAAWTNTNPDGTAASTTDCRGWTSAEVVQLGRFGVVGAYDGAWTDTGGTDVCYRQQHLYCVEDRGFED